MTTTGDMLDTLELLGFRRKDGLVRAASTVEYIRMPQEISGMFDAYVLVDSFDVAVVGDEVLVKFTYRRRYEDQGADPLRAAQQDAQRA